MPDVTDAPPQACPSCGTIVDVTNVEPLARVACPNCGNKFRVETAFDYFQLVETLGVGGMGSVYKARDTRLERFVALKLLRRELSENPEEAARLEQEARLTAAVNHPNVIQVYSSGTAHGQLYLVMELVDHGSLDDLIGQQTRVPELQVLEAGIHVARGLQAAHERGLIHRDVKPANILFSDTNTAKIGDFGLAVAAEHQAEARHEIWGTPYYVAPERLNNAPEDFRSDIYSLGATLFHAVAGRPPMEGETTSASELRKLKENPPGLRSIAPNVSRETARAIDKMLAPDPAKRFSSYAELIKELEQAREAIAPTRKKSSPIRSVLIALVAALVLFGAGAYVMRLRHPAVATPSPTPDNTAALQKRYDDARVDLLKATTNYEPAATAFSKLASDAGNKQPLANWARLHAGLALALEGKINPARDAWRSIETAGPFSTAKPDAELANFFLETAKALAAPGPIRGGAEFDNKGLNAFRLFLYGVKDWQLREFDEGAAFLQRFETSEVPNEWKWIGDYKPIAHRYVEDHALYADWKAATQRLTKAMDARAALEKIKLFEKRVQSRGALYFYFKDEEKSVSAVATNLDKAEGEARDRGAEEEFDKRKVALLAQWKNTLIKDLASGAYKNPITVGTTTHAGVLSANEREITLRIAPYGGAAFGWDKFPPPTLLAISRTFIRAGAPDAAEREWLAAVYAQSTGQTEIAHQLADEAAKTKPEYRDQIHFLFAQEH